MNVYDFDNTILRGDSTARFCAYCLRRYPAIWPDLPGQAVNALLFGLRLREKQAFKQRLLSFLSRIGDVDAAVTGFWEANFCRVKPFYRERHRPDDVVISASPEFLIAPRLRAAGNRARDGLAGGEAHGPLPRPQLSRRGETAALPRGFPRRGDRRILLRLPFGRPVGANRASGVSGARGAHRGLERFAVKKPFLTAFFACFFRGERL